MSKSGVISTFFKNAGGFAAGAIAAVPDCDTSLLIGGVAAALIAQTAADYASGEAQQRELIEWLTARFDELAMSHPDARLADLVGSIARGQFSHELASQTRARVLLDAMNGVGDRLEQLEQRQGEHLQITLAIADFMANWRAEQNKSEEEQTRIILAAVQVESKAIQQSLNDGFAASESRDEETHRLLRQLLDSQKQQSISEGSQRTDEPQPLPKPEYTPEQQELIDRALRTGDAMSKAAAAIAKRDFAAAAEFLPKMREDLTKQAFDALTLQGDFFYFQGRYDEALPHYEKAFHLAPESWRAIERLAVTHSQCRLGSIAGHQRSSIELHTRALTLVHDGSSNWATTQNNLGTAWGDLPTGDRAANIRNAIDCYTAALRVRTELEYPVDWALTQLNLGTAWRRLPTADRASNVKNAIDCYTAALRVCTERDHPVAWAMIQNNLGTAWGDLPTGDRAANIRNAIDCYTAALRVRTERDYPVDWAETLNNLGAAWGDLPSGDRALNTKNAIESFSAALRVCSERDHPVAWAMTQHNLGTAWDNLPTGDRAENIRNAIDCHTAALRVRTECDHPVDWAMTQNNLGAAWQKLPIGDRAANIRNAIDCHTSALRVYTERDHPAEWAMNQNNLGEAWGELPTGDHAANLRQAIRSYEAALTVWTPDAFPHYHKIANDNLATARRKLDQLGG